MKAEKWIEREHNKIIKQHEVFKKRLENNLLPKLYYVMVNDQGFTKKAAKQRLAQDLKTFLTKKEINKILKTL